MIQTYDVQIEQDPVTRVVNHERWRLEGKLHRVGAAALIDRDPQTGIVIVEEWYQNRLYHREDGPALIHRDKVTGAVIHERFFVRGHETEAAPEPMQQVPSGPSP